MTEKRRVIALGFFDGVHIGHSALMRKILEIGGEKNLVPSVITFDTHPQDLVSGAATPLINSPEDRTGLIRRIFGIDDIIFLHFDSITACMPWDEFVDQVVDEFGARFLVAGYDFKFGHEGHGNSELLARKCEQSGVGCEIIPEVKCGGVTSSSTYIRELLLRGDMERANAFLGHPHVLTDVVRYGYKLGRTLGTPTINMRFQDGVLVPPFGVYATIVRLDDGSAHIGVTNIGVRPTIGSSSLITAETHILDYHGNLYDHQIRVEFYKRLRPEIKFDDIKNLEDQIHKDCKTAQRYFADFPSGD